jgi:hypothetical protein
MIIFRISGVPAFPGLRRFHDGRDFNQWTGDDSKALMKVQYCPHPIFSLSLIFSQVYLAAIKGIVPDEMVECISAFMECCYIVRRNAITSLDLDAFNMHLDRFYQLRQVFVEAGVRMSISLPRQHALMHYVSKIERFASPNGVCSSITESTHIKAVKEPWRRSSRNDALPQMLRTISRLSKMTALRRVFHNRGMLDGNLLSYALAEAKDELPSIRSYGEQQMDGGAADDDDDEDDGGPLEGEPTSTQVVLAATYGIFFSRHQRRRINSSS